MSTIIVSRLHLQSNAPYPAGMRAHQGSAKRWRATVPPKGEAFVMWWSGREGGQERANYVMFLTEVCSASAVRPPEPAGDRTKLYSYVFERVATEAGYRGYATTR